MSAVLEHHAGDAAVLSAHLPQDLATRPRRDGTPRPPSSRRPRPAWPPTDAAFLDPTRWAIARQGIAAAVGENAGITYRWGLIRLRQRTPAWRASPACDKPVRVTDLSQTLYSDTTPCNAGGLGKYGIYAPSVAAGELRADHDRRRAR